MADKSSISQEVLEGAASEAQADISQAVLEGGADDAAVAISQAVLEGAPSDARTFISQIVIEYSTGPLFIPIPPVETARFDAGNGVSWYLVPQLSDSGVELRDKDIKAFRVTGKMTAPRFAFYGYGPTEEIEVTDIETGANSRSGVKRLTATEDVTQLPRYPLSIPNVRLHTVRLSGTWDGTGEKDRVDEMVYELALQGVRR